MILAELYFLSSFVATLKMELVFFHFVKAQKHF